MEASTQLNRVAYFSMEIAIDPQLPTYSGGLGVLAGDTIRAAADLGVPMVAVTLLYRQGYFRQAIAADGSQKESEVHWRPEDKLTRLPERAQVKIEGRCVDVQAWRYDVVGVNGHIVPIFFLDTDLPNNTDQDRRWSGSLYGGDNYYRIGQELLLGMGGVAMLNALGFAQPFAGKKSAKTLQKYHMNEGHAAFLTLALLQARLDGKALKDAKEEDFDAVRQHCVFTTHTPVPAGHDRFASGLVSETVGKEIWDFVASKGIAEDNMLNVTHLSLFFSSFVNGVAKRHGEVSQKMFAPLEIFKRFKDRRVEAITNGVHSSWVAPTFAQLFDRYVPTWRQDNEYLRYAHEIPLAEVAAAHSKCKQLMLDKVFSLTKERLDPKVFTIGFARRAAEYKRADLLLSDPEKLKQIASQVGPLQIIYAGKAHPKDTGGKALIKRVCEARERLKGSPVTLHYLEDYGMELGACLTAGVDLWLNNPLKPLEASGTSGMKAALNAVPSLSTLDGWWIEGWWEGVTGWEIEDDREAKPDDAVQTASPVAARSLYDKLEKTIMPLYYQNNERYTEIGRNSISINGSFFNTHRMMNQYQRLAYR